MKSVQIEETKKEKDNIVNDPLVSVIIPVYNAEKYIKTAVFSVLQQDYSNIEIICVNDGSTDSSLDILHYIEKRNPCVKVIDKPNGGPASARNAGLDVAKGKYVNFVDADDYVEQGMYKYLVELAEEEVADIVVFGGNPMYPNEGTPGWIWAKLSPPNKIYSGSNAGTEALFKEESSKPFLWLHLIKRSLIEQSPALRMSENLDLGEDQLFQFMYFPRAEKVVFTDRRFYNYRWFNEGSLMQQYYDKKVSKFRKHLVIVESVFSEWKKAGYIDSSFYLIDWAVSFLHDDLVKFPKYLQYEFASKIIDIFEEYNCPIYMCNVWVIDQALEIQKIAQKQVTFEDDCEKTLGSLKDKIEQVESEIKARMNSKSYKIGRKLTSHKKRLDEKTVLPPERKKN